MGKRLSAKAREAVIKPIKEGADYEGAGRWTKEMDAAVLAKVIPLLESHPKGMFTADILSAETLRKEFPHVLIINEHRCHIPVTDEKRLNRILMGAPDKVVPFVNKMGIICRRVWVAKSHEGTIVDEIKAQEHKKK